MFILSLSILSCKKEESGSSCATNMQLIAGSYKLSGMKYKANSTAAETEIINTLDACIQDDLFRFNVNGTYDYLDTGIVCSPGGTHSSVWALNGNMITVDGDAVTIESFNCKKLVVFQNDFIVPGDQITVTYTKQ